MLQPGAALLEVDHCLHLGDGHALHVEDAAAIDPGQLDTGRERGREPLLGIGRRDVDVVVQHQRPGVLAVQPGVEVGLARPHHLDADGDAGGLEPAGQEARPGHLVAGGLAGVDPHVLLEELHLGQVRIVALDPLLGAPVPQGTVQEGHQTPGDPPHQHQAGVEGDAGRLPVRLLKNDEPALHGTRDDKPDSSHCVASPQSWTLQSPAALSQRSAALSQCSTALSQCSALTREIHTGRESMKPR